MKNKKIIFESLTLKDIEIVRRFFLLIIFLSSFFSSYSAFAIQETRDVLNFQNDLLFEHKEVLFKVSSNLSNELQEGVEFEKPVNQLSKTRKGQGDILPTEIFKLKVSNFLILLSYLIFSFFYLLTIWNESINKSLGISHKTIFEDEVDDNDEVYLEMNTVFFSELFNKVSNMSRTKVGTSSLDKLLGIDHIQNSKLRSVIRASLIKRINLRNFKTEGVPLLRRRFHLFKTNFIAYEFLGSHGKKKSSVINTTSGFICKKFNLKLKYGVK
ncbi:hypothetical protein [Algoriphagus formosus]|uniref:hypothetical protein n=1 Tax=Algoriphagus formosus TaxID=2007308 RepID=UPI003F6F00FE